MGEFEIGPADLESLRMLVDSAEPRPIVPLWRDIEQHALGAMATRIDCAERALAEWDAAYGKLATMYRREVRLRMATSYMMGAGWAVAGALLVWGWM